MRQLEVYVNEVKAGLLTELNPGKGYAFAYDGAYVATYPHAIIARIVDERLKRFVRQSES